MRRAAALLALAGALLGIPIRGGAAAPEVASASPSGVLAFAARRSNPFGLRRVSYYSAPAFVDIDGDGDLDAFVGDDSANITFFENVGTPTAPAFAAPQTNPFGLTRGLGSYSTPTFADIDGDGDFDAFIGNLAGDIVFFKNTGTAHAPSFAASETNPFGLTRVGNNVFGNYSTPVFFDIDGDGDLDAFSGGYYGNTIFFRNDGTAHAPSFAAPQINPFGFANPEEGYYGAVAFADLDGDGDLDALVTNTAVTKLYTNTGTATAPAFVASPAPLGLTPGLPWNRLSLVDIDGDGDIDAFVGDYPGDVEFFENLTILTSPCPGAPDPRCVPGYTGALHVNENIPGKERLTARLSRGPLLSQAQLGDPLHPGGTAYALCVYDDQNERRALLNVDRAGAACAGDDCWQPAGGGASANGGFVYKDASAAADGVSAMRLLRGVGGRRSDLRVTAQNDARKGHAAMPVGIAAALAPSSGATVELRGSDAACFSTRLADVVKNTGKSFSAK